MHWSVYQPWLCTTQQMVSNTLRTLDNAHLLIWKSFQVTITWIRLRECQKCVKQSSKQKVATSLLRIQHFFLCCIIPYAFSLSLDVFYVDLQCRKMIKVNFCLGVLHLVVGCQKWTRCREFSGLWVDTQAWAVVLKVERGGDVVHGSGATGRRVCRQTLKTRTR